VYTDDEELVVVTDSWVVVVVVTDGGVVDVDAASAGEPGTSAMIRRGILPASKLLSDCWTACVTVQITSTLMLSPSFKLWIAVHISGTIRCT
jgi:butyrate kinase